MMILSFIPFIIVLVLMCAKVRDYISVWIGIVFAVIIYFISRITIEMQTISLYSWFKETILSNITIIASVYLLGYFMYLIGESSVIDEVQNKMEGRVGHVGLIPAISAVFSVDDYLSASVTSMLSAKLLGNTDNSRKSIGLIASMLSVVFCLLNPVSSWNPVIFGAYNSSNIPREYYYGGLKYNLIIIFFVLSSIRLMHGIQTDNHIIKSKRKLKHSLHRGVSDVIVILSVLFVSFVITDRIKLISCPLLIASVVADVFASIWLIKRGFIDSKSINKVRDKTVSEISPLAILLLSIWSFVYIIDDGLGIGNNIIHIIESINASTYTIPALIFVCACVFSYVTGSSYGSFGLFIALASKLSLSMPEEYQIITISAAVAGSLFALFSVGSDVLGISATGIGCTRSEIRNKGKVLAVKMFIFGVIGYIGLGFVPQNGHSLFLIVICAIFYLIIRDSKNESDNKNELCNGVFIRDNRNCGLSYGDIYNYIRAALVQYYKNYWKIIKLINTKSIRNSTRIISS